MSKMKRFLLLLMPVLTLNYIFSLSSYAVVYPPEIEEELERRLKLFIEADSSYKALPESLSFEGDDYYSKERFSEDVGNSISMPDSDMNPVEKAITLFEYKEGILPRVRYKIEYAPYYDGYSGYRANVQITRFNLGPKIREELIADYGEEHAAPAEELGVGPHVSWRVVFQPIQGNLSMPSAIVRKELTDSEAEKIQCIEIPCMSLSQPLRGEEKWTATETPEKDYLKAEDSVPKADLIDRRLAKIGGIYFQQPKGQPSYGEVPEGLPEDKFSKTLVLSKDVDGQESLILGVLHESYLMDDDISDQWHLRTQIIGQDPTWEMRNQQHAYRASSTIDADDENSQDKALDTTASSTQDDSKSAETGDQPKQTLTNGSEQKKSLNSTEVLKGSEQKTATNSNDVQEDANNNELHLEVPKQAKVRSTIQINWQGPQEWDNVIDIVPEGSLASARSNSQARSTQGSPVFLQAPSQPGDYEIRYKKNKTQQVLFKKSIQIE